MTWKRIRTWAGGYVREDERGRRVFVLEKWLGGARIHRSTGCTTERAAMKELERFELDPVGYRPAGRDEGAVHLTDELVSEYGTHQRAKGLSGEWVDEVQRCLADWMEALGPLDLRHADLHRDLKPALATWPTRRPHRIKALKGLVRWLQEERGLLRDGQGGTSRLRVPQAKPAMWSRRKVVSVEDAQAVLHKLPQPTRDVFHLITATSWHLSEIRRFAEGGELVPPLHGEALAVVVARHKTGELAKQSLRFPEHVEAARRLRERGGLPKRMTLARHMLAACEAARVPAFGLGQLRHSVLTWGVERGASVADAADFAQHKSERTTRRHYVDLETPGLRFPVVRLATD